MSMTFFTILTAVIAFGLPLCGVTVLIFAAFPENAAEDQGTDPATGKTIPHQI